VSAEIISIAEMRAIDAASAEGGAPTRTLMENAGAAVAVAVMERFAPQPTAVLCGPGANGGDGWVAARVLRDAGWPVWVESLTPREALTGDTADAASGFRGRVSTLRTSETTAELFIDALFGAGLSKPLEGDVAALSKRLPKAQVVAVDVPSGLQGDTAKALGEHCFDAALTVTFVRKKLAHVLMPGRSLCGEIVVADIGTPASAFAGLNFRTFENGPGLWRLPKPAIEAHKHARGHAMIASGGRARSGAARLSARAALRVGAGLVTMLSPPDAVAENAAQLNAIMLREVENGSALATLLASADAGVVGPAFGLTPAHGEALAALLRQDGRPPIVLDADALTLLAPLHNALGLKDVITPHRGEFERLFPDMYKSYESRVEAARAAAEKAHCVVLLKGPDTVITAPDGRSIVNTTGSPYLATAGSGDVLAGMIAGLIAQGMTAFDAAAAAAWMHGRMGEALGPGQIADEYSDFLPIVLKDLLALEENAAGGSGSPLLPGGDLG
jgi:hydroxyethylthiazole kinase-like uncharacterized protein yjeF